jgi:hypothetical protein
MTPWPAEWLSNAPAATCPAFGERARRPILLGMPSGDVIEARDAGEIDIEIGGCCITDDHPTHRCAACGESFAASPTETR